MIDFAVEENSTFLLSGASPSSTHHQHVVDGKTSSSSLSDDIDEWKQPDEYLILKENCCVNLLANYIDSRDRFDRGEEERDHDDNCYNCNSQNNFEISTSKTSFHGCWLQSQSVGNESSNLFHRGLTSNFVVENSTYVVNATFDNGSQKLGIVSRSIGVNLELHLKEAAEYFEVVGEIPSSDGCGCGSVQEVVDDGTFNFKDDDRTVSIGPLHTANGDEAYIRYDIEIDLVLDDRKEEQLFLTPQGNYDIVHGGGGISKSSNYCDLFSYQFPARQRETVECHFEYRGISANPPEIAKRGILRGNRSQIHRKAWLEVSDERHRYGKNLRLYYRYWEKLGYPTNQFFDWLDSKGDAEGNPLPSLEECSRDELDSDTVLYIDDMEITKLYALRLCINDFDESQRQRGRCQILGADDQIVSTGPDGWIFVLRDNELYGAPKITSISKSSYKQRFHHSSFFGGKAVAAAGILVTDANGFLLHFYPHSGHYRPGDTEIQRMLFFLHDGGVNLKSFLVDTQQLFRVNRDECNKKNDNEVAVLSKKKKKKKMDSLHLLEADFVASYLSHKARFIGEGISSQICKNQVDNA